MHNATPLPQRPPGICDHCRLPGTETVRRLAADLADFGGSMISTVNGTEYICFDRDSDEYGDMGLVYYWAYGAPGPDDEEPSFDSDGNIMRCVNESWCAGCLNAVFAGRFGWNHDRPHSPKSLGPVRIETPNSPKSLGPVRIKTPINEAELPSSFDSEVEWCEHVKACYDGYPEDYASVDAMTDEQHIFYLSNHNTHFCDYTENDQSSCDLATLVEHWGPGGRNQGAHWCLAAGADDNGFASREEFWHFVYAAFRFHSFLTEVLESVKNCVPSDKSDGRR